MHDPSPFTVKARRHTPAVELGLRNEAERSLKNMHCIPADRDPRIVVYGNFGDVVSWDEVNELYEQELAQLAG